MLLIMILHLDPEETASAICCDRDPETQGRGWCEARRLLTLGGTWERSSPVRVEQAPISHLHRENGVE